MAVDEVESDYSDLDSIHSDEEELLEDYKKGGYHPVAIGDRLQDDRYVIVRKLGWGHFSTVWLARDTRCDRHVALKIVKSDPRFTESALEEIKLLEKVKNANENATGRQYIAQMLDHFWHEGPNGKHACMVFEVLGESLLSLIKRYKHRGIPAGIVKRITKQVIMGVDYLHRECGIIHTDLKPENVLVWIPDIEDFLQTDTAKIMESILAKEKEKAQAEMPSVDARNLSPTTEETEVTANITQDTNDTQASNATISQPDAIHPLAETASNGIMDATADLEHPLNGLQHTSSTKKKKNKKRKSRRKKKSKSGASRRSSEAQIEKHLADLKLQDKPVKIIPSSMLDISMSEKSKDGSLQAYDRVVVKIVDLGNACWTNEEYTHIIQTRQYRSPEVIVGAKWTHSADMWSIACMTFELLTGDYLFDPRPGSKYNKDDDHLALVIELMGVVPRSLTAGGEFSREFFTAKGELRHIKTLRYHRLRDVLHDNYQTSPEEADTLSSFLLPMLEVDASKRADPQDALAHQWLKDVSIE